MLGAGDPTANRPDIPMTKRTAEQLVNSLGDHRFDDLDLIVQSSGGDIHAAYLIMSTLRERMNKGRGKLIACVPSRAQSAATLLCLGADKILLGELTIFNFEGYRRGFRSRPGLARKPSRRPGRYCICRSRVLTSLVS
jgi:ATP-dependent protease ClpP protease subunit